jgi:hypothetical protein
MVNLCSSQRNMFAGGCPEYWSAEMGSLFEMIKDRAKDEINYKQAVQLMPALTDRSDIYQLGLLAI